MKEDPSENQNQKTSALKGTSTSPLEQLPPTKKRDLRTGSLNASAPGISSPPMHEPEVEIRPPQPQPRVSAPKEEKPVAPAPVKIVPPQPPTFPSPQHVQEPAAALFIEPPVVPQAPPVPTLPEPVPRAYEPPVEKKFEAPAAAPSHQREPSLQPALSVKSAPEPVFQHTARTEAVQLDSNFTVLTEPVKSSYADNVELFGFGGYVEKPTNEPPRSIWRSLALLSIPIILLLITCGLLIKYVPGVRDRMPARIASLFGGSTNTLPQVSVQEYRILLDEKENTATISGIITNISNDAVGPIQVELELSKREDVRITDKKTIPIEPAQLAPKATGKYEMKISAKDYQQSKVSRILVGGNPLRVKKLKDILDPTPPLDPNESSPGPAEQPSQPKPDPNKVYDGSVSFK